MNASSDGEQRAEGLNIIAETTTALSRSQSVAEICTLLGSTVYDFNEEAYVIVSLFDEELGAIRIRDMFGFGDAIKSLRDLFGRHPRRMTFSPQDMTEEELRLFSSGRIERFPGGLYALLTRKVPQPLCRRAERLLGVDEIYSVGFALDDEAYGGLIIMPRKGTEVRYPSAIEALIAHAAVVVKHRRAERELRRSEERYRFLVHNQGEGIGFVDSQERFTFVNLAAHEIFGIPPGDLEGRSLREFVDEETFAFLQQQTELRREGEKSTYEIEIQRPDGERRNLLVTATPQFDDGGDFIGTAGIFRDITERKRTQEALQESEARFRALTMSAQDAIIMVDAKGTISLWNRAAEEIFGYTREEALGRDLHSLLAPGASREATQAAFSRFQRTGRLESVRDDAAERVGVRKDGTEVPIELSLAPVELGDGWHAVAIVRDITERVRAEERERELEEQLEAARRLESIGQLAGGVAHDFNNLLTPIMGYAQLIQGELPADSAVQEEVEEILDASERARQLVRQLLAFGRRQILQVKPLDLNEVVSEFESFLRRTIREDIDIRLELEPSLGRVRADANQMEQILMNLASNAQDAMPEGGEITIRTDNVCLDAAYARDHAEVEEGCYVMLSFSDTGIGMSEEVQDRLFEPFFTTKEMGEGTGMGLPTVYGIVKQHGGNIHLYSEEGEGTTFKVYLPRIDGDVREQEEAHAVSPKAGDQEVKGTILVVEDDDMVRDLARRVLEDEGYDVLTARNGAEALEALEAHAGSLRLLVTDVVMPGDNGEILSERVRQLYPRLKVLYMSGYSDREIGDLDRSPDKVDFLPKPFSVVDLLRAVRNLLD